MPTPVPAEIDLDADLMTFRSRGNEVQVYAADFVDTVLQRIKDADESDPLPNATDEHGNPRNGTHAEGEPFIKILTEELEVAGLSLLPNRALAAWNSMKQKTVEYRSFFENGPSSRPSSDAHPLTTCAADVQVSEQLYKLEDGYVPPSDSTHSTTESSNTKPANAT